MATIVLTEEQTRLLTASGEPVTVTGPDGLVIGILGPWMARAVARAAAAKSDPGPFFSTDQVFRRLDALDRGREAGGKAFDRAAARTLLDRMTAEDPPRLGRNGEPCTG